MANEYSNIERIIKELKDVLQREYKRPEDCADLTPSMRALLEEEIIPALENELDYDPTPEYLYDHSDGEPPVTMNEMWQQAHRESQALKR